jgi:hypothetical protein
MVDETDLFRPAPLRRSHIRLAPCIWRKGSGLAGRDRDRSGAVGSPEDGTHAEPGPELRRERSFWRGGGIAQKSFSFF